MIVTEEKRKVILTFIVAGLAAVLGEHYLKPTLKGKLNVR